MKYIYTNVTQSIQNCLLATKSQDSVGTRTFAPGATLTLDYPGLNLYVPNTLSCITIDIDDATNLDILVVKSVKTVVEEIKQPEEQVIELDEIDENIPQESVEQINNEQIVPPPVTEPVILVVTAPKAVAPKVPKKKLTTKKTKK